MKRKFRLTKSSDFKRVRRSGKSYAHPLIVLIAAPGQAENIRFGIAAGRSLGGAVQRNRAKRLLRAALQPHLISITPGWDVMLIARAPLLTARFPQIQAAMVAILAKAGLLHASDEN